jgi:hypothetical protein
MKGLRVLMNELQRMGYQNIPLEVNKETVNTPIYPPLMESSTGVVCVETRTLLGWLVEWPDLDPSILYLLLDLGATIEDEMLADCYSIRDLNILLWYGGNPNAQYKDGYFLWQNKLNTGVMMLFEYGAYIPFDLGFNEEEQDFYNDIRAIILRRRNKCRRALLTLIWISEQAGLASLKPLFVEWSKWIWSLPPYTREVHPNIGPSSRIWDY